jgi:hypothetical protein
MNGKPPVPVHESDSCYLYATVPRAAAMSSGT